MLYHGTYINPAYGDTISNQMKNGRSPLSAKCVADSIEEAGDSHCKGVIGSRWVFVADDGSEAAVFERREIPVETIIKTVRIS